MSNKLMIIVLALIVVIMLAMGGGFFMMWSKMATLGAPPPDADAEVAEEELEDEGPPEMGPIFNLQPFIVNLAEDGGSRYLRVTIDMELDSEESMAEVEKRLPQIRNNMLMILPSKKIAEISTSEGKTALRDEMLEAVNELLATGEIANIYFSEFVIQ